MTIKKILWIAAITASLTCQNVCANGSINIIPKPLQAELQQGSFTLDEHVVIVNADSSKDALGDYLSAAIREQTGLKLNTQRRASWFGREILLKAGGSKSDLGQEGYELTVTKNNVTITAPRSAGLFYGVQSLLQLIPLQGGETYTIPCIKIKDRPRFRWRGLMLDESRHFFGAEAIKKYIDLLALHKMNVFHWHLVDDQGWRLEIKKYPKLTEIGAWRTGNDGLNFRYWGFRFPRKNSDQNLYGGYYTQDQVREIVAYAKARRITIVPEIEMPGHSWAALVAYPELTCRQTQPDTEGHHEQNAYCAGKEETFRFLENILDEVLDLFDSDYIHIGGDEVEKHFWSHCDDCQRRMKEEGLENTDQLQSWFIKRMETYLNAQGRRLIGWDEILQGGLAPNATVMSWRGISGGIAAAKAGHDVVMSPGTHCYFDHYQADPDKEPKAWGGLTTLEKVYSYEPIPSELTAKQAQYILGAQGNVWTEWIFDSDRVEYMAYPRACALSEVVWSPKESRNWDDFQDRLGQHLLRLDKMEVHYRLPEPVGIEAHNVFLDEMTVHITKPVPNAQIRYTLDGSAPTASSLLYADPIHLTDSAVIKAVAVTSEGRTSAIREGFYEKQTLLSPVTVDNLHPGIEYEYLEGRIWKMAEWDRLSSVRQGIQRGLILPKERGDDNFAVVLSGYIKIDTDGIYRFYTRSDDGSTLKIGDRVVVDNDGDHAALEKSGQVALCAGLHPIEVKFFELGGAEALHVSYEGPGISKAEIPANVLFYTSG
jgi:hexosaminidase